MALIFTRLAYSLCGAIGIVEFSGLGEGFRVRCVEMG